MFFFIQSWRTIPIPLFASLRFQWVAPPMQCGKSFTRGIRSFGLWNLEFNSWNPDLSPEIRNPAAIKIRNPSSTDEESRIQYMESRIHSVESRIEDFLGLPYMGRNEQNIHHETRTAPHMRLTELTKSVHSFVPNHSLLKEENVLVNPPNSNSKMLLSAYSYFD